MLSVSIFPQWEFGYKNTGGGTGSSRYSAVDLDGSSEYLYRNYAAADSFLNLNGYDRVQLPQSTMKIGFNTSGVALNLAFSSASDTNYVPTYTRDSANVISGGKLQMRLGAVDGSGIRTSFTLSNGAMYYVKFKIRWVSGTRINISVYNGFGAVSPQGITTFPTSEETNYEFTAMGRGDRLYFIGIDSCAYQTYELDDIEVREISNSVTNGTMDSTGAWSGTGWSVTGGVLVGASPSTAVTKNNQAPSIGRRYRVTYQISGTFTGTSLTMSYGGTSGTARTAAGVYSDEITATSTGVLTFTPVSVTACTLDNVHIYEIPSYRGAGNHSVGWSKVDALPNSSSDTTSLRIISTGAGSASANYAYIVSGANTYHSTTSGSKYTLELFCRANGLVTNKYVNNFTTTDGWNTGQGNRVIIDSNMYFYKGTYATVYGNKTLSGITSGSYVRVKFWAKSDSSTSTMILSVQNSFSILPTAISNPSLSTTTRYYEFLGRVSGTSAQLIISTGDLKAFTLDSMRIDEITQPTIGLHVQGQTKTSDTLSVIPGQFEKVVFNFEANSTVADSIRIYLSQSDTLWVDSLNLTQAYDYIVDFWAYPNSTNPSTSQNLFWNGAESNASRGHTLSWVSGFTYPIYYMGDGNIRVVGTNYSTITFIPSYTYFQIVVKRGSADSLIAYANGVYAGYMSTSGLGSIKNTNRFEIGSRTNGTTGYWGGKMGEFRITKFDNIRASSWTTSTPLSTYNAYTRGAGFTDNITGGGKKIAVWYDWSIYDTDANLLMDLSGNGYNLVGSGVTTADHVFFKR